MRQGNKTQGSKETKLIGLRCLKKLQKRAMKALIKRHQYHRTSFDIANGEDEAVVAPKNLNPKFAEGNWTTPLKGTPLFWVSSGGYWDPPEGDYHLPSEVLKEVEWWERVSKAEEQKMQEIGRQKVVVEIDPDVYGSVGGEDLEPEGFFD